MMCDRHRHPESHDSFEFGGLPLSAPDDPKTAALNFFFFNLEVGSPVTGTGEPTSKFSSNASGITGTGEPTSKSITATPSSSSSSNPSSSQKRLLNKCNVNAQNKMDEGVEHMSREDRTLTRRRRGQGHEHAQTRLRRGQGHARGM